MEILNIGNRISNNYLIKFDGGNLLIDTGYPEQFHSFCEKLSKNNMQCQDISYILLTHSHDDHAGFLNEVMDNSEAKLILHPKAVERLKKGQNSFEGGCSSRLALNFCRVMKLFGKGEHGFPPVDRPERYIVLDEATQQFIEKELSCKIISLPGHTIDSIGVMLDNGSLFCGDAAMNGFPSMNRVIIWIENLKEFKKSWEKIINCNPAKIFPSHGKPFTSKDIKKNIHKIDKIKLYALNLIS